MSSNIDYLGGRSGSMVGTLFFGILIGVVAGGIAALILAPKSGRETRELIRGRAMETGQMIQDRFNDVRSRFSKASQAMYAPNEQEMQASEKTQ
jgi:gas vesicle protein